MKQPPRRITALTTVLLGSPSQCLVVAMICSAGCTLCITNTRCLSVTNCVGYPAGRPCVVQVVNYKRNGDVFINYLSVTPIHDSQGTLTHYVGIQSDITDVVNHKKAELAAKHAAVQVLLTSISTWLTDLTTQHHVWQVCSAWPGNLVPLLSSCLTSIPCTQTCSLPQQQFCTGTFRCLWAQDVPVLHNTQSAIYKTISTIVRTYYQYHNAHLSAVPLCASTSSTIVRTYSAVPLCAPTSKQMLFTAGCGSHRGQEPVPCSYES